jgi:hypothetical protein
MQGNWKPNSGISLWKRLDVNDGAGGGGSGSALGGVDGQGAGVGTGDEGAGAGDAGAQGQGDQGQGTPEDLSTIFSPEEVTAKKEALTAAKTEEDRRAALTEEERTAEDAQKAEEAKANQVPEKYEFKIPDGMQMDTALLAETEPLFKELEITQANAQKLIDLYAQKIYPAIIKQNTDAWMQQTEAWKKEVAQNNEIKINKEGENEDGLRVINTLLTPEEAKAFKADLNKFGIGNHPLLNLMYARMAASLKEDTFEGGVRKAGGEPKDIAHRIFPNLP